MTQRASPVKYNLDLLIKFCNENHITLLKDYSGELVNRETRIEGKCLSEGCENNFDKTFRNLYKINGYCKECSMIINKEKGKATCLKKHGVEHYSQTDEYKEKCKATCLKNFGVEHPSQSQEVRDKYKATCLKFHGVEHYSQTDEYKEKFKETCLKNHGVEYPSQSQEIKDKKKATCLEKYGVEYSLQSQEVREKGKVTCKEKFGVENPSQSDTIKQQKIATCLENHGVEHPAQSQEIKEKMKATCLTNLGFEYPGQSQEVKEKGKATCLKKYNVKHAMQNPEIADKSSKASYSRKDYTLPSGKIIQVQGYEPYALDELVHTFNEDEIITGSGSVPEIWYDDDEGLKHRHFVDIFIPSQNKCIEVKSTWTAEKKKDNIFKKQQAGKQLGYNYEIWIYNSKGEKVECIV